MKYNRLPTLKKTEHLQNLQNDKVVWHVPMETLQDTLEVCAKEGIHVLLKLWRR